MPELQVDCEVCGKRLLTKRFGDVADADVWISVPLCTTCQRRITDVAFEEGYQSGLEAKM